jgi:hypothetical protein
MTILHGIIAPPPCLKHMQALLRILATTEVVVERENGREKVEGKEKRKPKGKRESKVTGETSN